MSTNTATPICETPKCTEIASVVIDGWDHQCAIHAAAVIACKERHAAWMSSPAMLADLVAEAAQIRTHERRTVR